MRMLEARSTYFYEMGIGQYDKYNKERLASDKDLLLCIGYMFEFCWLVSMPELLDNHNNRVEGKVVIWV